MKIMYPTCLNMYTEINALSERCLMYDSSSLSSSLILSGVLSPLQLGSVKPSDGRVRGRGSRLTRWTTNVFQTPPRGAQCTVGRSGVSLRWPQRLLVLSRLVTPGSGSGKEQTAQSLLKVVEWKRGNEEQVHCSVWLLPPDWTVSAKTCLRVPGQSLYMINQKWNSRLNKMILISSSHSWK